MTAKKQTPGVQAGDSLDPNCMGCLYPSHIASNRQAQLLITRFGLSPWVARDVAWLCFGEGCND